MKVIHWVLLSAGAGTRMNMKQPKTLGRLGSQPVFIESLNRAVHWLPTRSICVTASADYMDAHRRAIENFFKEQHDQALQWHRTSLQFPLKEDHPALVTEAEILGRKIQISVTEGGTRRQDSVHRGVNVLSGLLGSEMAAATDRIDIVFIHDSARPFLEQDVCDHLAQTVDEGRGAIPGLPVEDTIKKVILGGREVQETLPRDQLVRVQTPQAFVLDDFLSVINHKRWLHEDVTDDAQMAESYGLAVEVVPGSDGMRKLTTQKDWEWAQSLVKSRASVLGKATTFIPSSADVR